MAELFAIKDYKYKINVLKALNTKPYYGAPDRTEERTTECLTERKCTESFEKKPKTSDGSKVNSRFVFHETGGDFFLQLMKVRWCVEETEK